MRTLHAFVAIACGALFVAAASAGSVEVPVEVGGAYSVPVQTLKERRLAGTVRQQRDYSCGSAALSTLLTNHYGDPVAEQQVFDAMFALGDEARIQRDGFSLLDMKRYLAARGYAANGFEASLDSLAEAGLPAIALIDERGYHHFVVIKGIRDGRVVIGDPAEGTRVMTLEAFAARRVNSILFVIDGQQQLAQFNRDADWAVLPHAPLAGRLDVAGSIATLPRLGPSDF
ncbi:MAG: C39 family peptidase [Burkholderiales bacterium]